MLKPFSLISVLLAALCMLSGCGGNAAGSGSTPEACSAVIRYQPQDPLEEEAAFDASGAEVEVVRRALNALDYSPDTCDGIPEYEIMFSTGEQFYVNKREGWVWKDGCEAALPESLAEDITQLCSPAQ